MSLAKFCISVCTLPAYEHIASLLYAQLKEGQYDVVHAHDIIALIAAVKLKKKSPSLRVIWDAHELYSELSYKDPRARKYIDKLIRSLSGYVDYFVTINESILDYYRENYKLLPVGRVVMNATCKVNNSDLLKSDKLQLSTGISADQKILLFQGGLGEGRGIPILLHAAQQDYFPEDWSIVFMGNGSLGALIDDNAAILNKRRAKNCPLVTHIPPAPFDELVQWTSGATVGIIPYEYTSLNHLYCSPNKLWEYPNAGIPILATDFVEMNKMIVRHGIGSLLPRHFTSDDIINSLVALDDDTIEKMSAACIAFNLEENWEKYAPILLNLYSEISC